MTFDSGMGFDLGSQECRAGKSKFFHCYFIYHGGKSGYVRLYF